MRVPFRFLESVWKHTRVSSSKMCKSRNTRVFPVVFHGLERKHMRVSLHMTETHNPEVLSSQRRLQEAMLERIKNTKKYKNNTT